MMLTWYLVLGLTSSSPVGPSSYFGPMTLEQCERSKEAIAGSVGCRRAVAMMQQSYNGGAYAVPIFEGDGYVTTGSLK